MKGYPFIKLFNIHVRGGKYQSKKEWPRLGLLKIRSKFGYSKVHNYLLVKVFIVIYFNLYLFFHHVLYIESLKKYWNEIVTKNAFEC
jgi:hypothetical protein